MTRLEEAEKRDHRKLGRQLDLFSSPDELGPGLWIWHPRGGIFRKQLEDYVRDLHLERGYDLVVTPHIARSVLWETSGHLAKYADNMYPPMETDTGDYYVKPMNCPFHVLVYKSQVRSYRDLPMRLSELGHHLPPRAAGRAARAAPHPRRDAGRLAHHLHARPADRRDPQGVRADVRDPRDVRVRRSDRQPVDAARADDPGRGDGRARHRGARDGARARAACRTRRPRARARSTGRRSTSTSRTRSAGCGSSPRCSATSRCPSGSTWSTPATTTTGIVRS